jgi:hypothetical protein
MKHLGILAHSTEGAALCFLEFCQEGVRRLGSHVYPDVTLDYIAFGHSLPAWDAGDHATVRAGHRQVGVLGTRYLIDAAVYPRALGSRGMAAAVPDEDDRRTIDKIIFAELVNGVVTDQSRREYVRVIERLAARGCDAVALACTEISLLVTPDVAPLPTLDSTRILARAAFDVAAGERAIPTWRGGPTER